MVLMGFIDFRFIDFIDNVFQHWYKKIYEYAFI